MLSSFVLKAIAVVTLAMTVGHAAPVETVQIRAAETTSGHFKACTGTNFGGTCNTITFSTTVCLNFIAPLADAINSVQPDSGFVCLAFVDPNCQGQNFLVRNPGLSSLNAPFANALSSFECFVDK